YQVESYLAAMFNPTVQLKSGGYIVIGVTEALVAIDVNSGRATKEGSIEETATKTNLEAAEEVARQLRLRDLAGLIVIDFIDMDDRRNNAKVEKMMKDKLKTDRARIQVGRISAFGLMEMSRQRLRPGMIEATTQPCPHCHGTGLVRSDDSMALSILRQLEEEGTRRRSREVLLTAPVGIVNFIMNTKREYLAAIEARYGLSIRVEADPSMVSPDYKVEKFKTATRRVMAAAPVVSMDAALMEEIEGEAVEEADADAAEAPETNGDGDAPKKKRRRRRGGRGRRKSGGEDQNEAHTTDGEASDADDATSDDAPAQETAVEDAPEAAEPAAEEKPKRRRRSRKKPEPKPEETTAEDTPAETEAAVAASEPEAEVTPEPEPAPAPEPVATEPEPEPEPMMAEAASEPVAAEPEPAPEPAKPKRKGWWSLG
ncbi:MAG: ribonuclease E/G, partial [Pseudomonadota bacterium]